MSIFTNTSDKLHEAAENLAVSKIREYITANSSFIRPIQVILAGNILSCISRVGETFISDIKIFNKFIPYLTVLKADELRIHISSLNHEILDGNNGWNTVIGQHILIFDIPEVKNFNFETTIGLLNVTNIKKLTNIEFKNLNKIVFAGGLPTLSNCKSDNCPEIEFDSTMRYFPIQQPRVYEFIDQIESFFQKQSEKHPSQYVWVDNEFKKCAIPYWRKYLKAKQVSLQDFMDFGGLEPASISIKTDHCDIKCIRMEDMDTVFPELNTHPYSGLTQDDWYILVKINKLF